jgi:hypothetical protein
MADNIQNQNQNPNLPPEARTFVQDQLTNGASFLTCTDHRPLTTPQEIEQEIGRGEGVIWKPSQTQKAG